MNDDHQTDETPALGYDAAGVVDTAGAADPAVAPATGVALEGETAPADGEMRDTTIGASIEDAPAAPADEEVAEPAAAVVEEAVDAVEPDAEPEQIAPVPEVVEPEPVVEPVEEAPVEPIAAVAPYYTEKPIPSMQVLDVGTGPNGTTWDRSDPNRPSALAAAADLAARAAAAAPYLELLRTSKDFEPHAVLHTPFGKFAIDEHTGKSLMASLTDGTSLSTLVRVDEIHRIAGGGALHAGYARHEVATSMVMPLSSVFGLEPWPVEKPDTDALVRAKEIAAANAALLWS